MQFINKQYSELVLGMTLKELKARYKYTLFGFLWMIINPILQMLTIGFVFQFFIKVNIENYYFYLLIGLLIWNFFSFSLTKATPSIVWERNLIKKAKFPRSCIPLSIILSNFVHLIIGLILIIIPLIFINEIILQNFLFCIISLILLLLLTIGFSLLSSALNVKYRDVNFFTQALLTIWFYATPIVYDLSIVPEKYKFLWFFNPLTSIVQLAQFAFLNKPIDSYLFLLPNIGIILIIFYVGIIIFNNESRYFDDWI